MKKTDRNRSMNIPDGTILQTRDEYLHKQGNYRKPGYEKKGNYRKLAVVDSNKDNELAVVKLYSQNGTELKGSKSRYKPFVETLDDTNKRIKVGSKFIPNGQKLSGKHISTIKKDCFENPRVRVVNRKKVRRLKGRK